MEGELEKRIVLLKKRTNLFKEDVQNWIPIEMSEDWKYIEEYILGILKEAKKELQISSYISWVSPYESKPAIKYICIEHDKFIKWFGDLKNE